MSGLMTMAYRDHTKHFRELRNAFRNDSQSSGADSNTDYTTTPLVLNNNLNNNATSLRIPIEQISPVWNETLQSMDNEMLKIEQQMAMLKEYHSSRSRILFESDTSAELDANIQETTMAITSVMLPLLNDVFLHCS